MERQTKKMILQFCRTIRALSFVIMPLLFVMMFLASGARMAVAVVNTASGQMQAKTKSTFKDNELLVKFKQNVTEGQKNKIHKRLGSTVIKEHKLLHVQKLKLKKGLTVEKAVSLYRSDSSVEYAEPNYSVSIDTIPNDPSFNNLWGLNNTGQTGGTPDADINAPEAWDHVSGSQETIVAIIDTGIDYTHQDLAANIWTNPGEIPGNGIDDDNNGYIDDVHGINAITGSGDPLDDHNHGTHVSGTIAALGNNNIGVAGINWSAKLVACKFLNSGGSGWTDDAAECLEYLYTLKTRSVNPVNIIASSNSWGGGGFSQTLLDAIDLNRSAGILFIAAAGNSSSDNDLVENYPSNYDLPNVIAVAATDHNDNLAYFSSYGRRTVHVGAPGVDILSTTRNNTYSTFSGTSMATPHVTGLVSLLKSDDPSLDWKSLKNLVLAGGKATSATTGRTITGKRIRAMDSDGTGSLSCSNQTVFSRLQPRGNDVSAAIGSPLIVSAVHINCGTPAGDVTVAVSDGTQFVLMDDGLGIDLEAGDGIYSAQWAPPGYGTYVLSLPEGDAITVHVVENYLPAVETTYSYRSIAGANLELGDDQTGTIPSPFPIHFGNDASGFNTLVVSSNGNISFTDSNAAYFNASLPTASYHTLVAPLWDDLHPGMGGGVYWETLGTAPNRELVIEWRGVPHYSCGDAVTFQAVFFEGRPDILFNYGDVDFGNPLCNSGASATVGVQIGSTLAQQYSFDSPSLRDGLALLWTMASFRADAGPDQFVLPGATVALNGTWSRPGAGGVITSYQWIQTAGLPVSLQGADTPAPSFTAPATKEMLTFTLTVTDSLGNTGSDSVNVTVNTPPIADAGPDVLAVSGTILALNGFGSYDQDGTIASYQWVQTAGTPVVLNGAATPTPDFTVPLVEGTLTFLLTVRDDSGQSASDTVSVSIFNDCNGPENPVPVSPGTGWQGSSSINDLGEMVWVESDPVNNGYVLRSSVRGQLYGAPDISNVSLNNRSDVVWEQGGQVYGIIQGQFTQLTYNGGYQPSINDAGEMVWYQFDNTTGFTQIYSNLRGRLTSDAVDHYNASINNRGDVVWEQYDPTNGWSQIYGLIGGAPAQITTGQAWHIQPSISNTGEVVWVQSQTAPMEGRVYSSTRGQLTFGCPSSFGQSEPSVNACGDLTFTNTESTGQVVYRLGNSSPCVSDPEPNDSMSNAVTVGGNSTTTGMLDSMSDMEDWYQFTANAGDQIKISVNWTPGTPPAPLNILEMELLSPWGQLAYNNGSTTPMTMIGTSPSSGTHYVRLRSMSGRFGYSLSVSIPDITPPTVSVSSPASGITNNNRPVLLYSVSDGAVVVKVDGIVVTKVSGDTLDILADGPHTVQVESTDAAGNTGIAEVSFTVDTTAPVVVITSPAGGYTNNITPLLSYTASDGAVVVKVDGIVVTKVSGNTLDPLADGPHTVRVEATDAATNTGFAEVSFTVDATIPTVTITSPAPGHTSNRTPLLTYTASDGTVIVKVDGVVVPKVSGDTLDMLADGLHAVRVEATDAAGNTGFAEVSFTVDTAAPTVTITSPVTGITNNNTPLLAYSVSDGTVVVRVDSLVVNKVSGDALDTLGDGPHVVRVESTDAAGNTGYAEVAFTVDTTAPVVTVTSPVAGLTNNNAPMLISTVSDGAVVVKVDGVVVNKVSGDTLDVLPDGPHVVRVDAMDAAGNPGFAEVSFAVDTVSPVVGIDPVSTPTKTIAQTISGTRESNAAISVAANTTASIGPVSYPSATTWSCAITGLAEGANTIAVTAADSATNSATVETSITLDTAAPLVSISSPAAGITKNNQPFLTYAVSDGAVVVKVDNSVVQKVSGDALDTLADGPHVVRVEATDPAGNLGFAEVGFTVDTVAPAVTITSPVAGPTKTNTPTLTYTVSDGIAVVKVDGVVVTKASGSTLDILSDGAHTVRVEATDEAGNAGFASVTVTVDTAPPSVGINTVATPTNTGSQTITGTREANAVITVAVNTSATAGTVSYPTSTTWSCTISGFAQGANMITAAATDAAGNSAEASTSITYDITAPTVTISSPSASPTNDATPPLSYTVSDGTVVVKVDGVVVSKVSGQSLDALADGNHTVRVEATDAAGNPGSASVTFTVDTVSPAIAINPVTTPTRLSYQTITGTRESDSTVTVSLNTAATPGPVSYPTSTTWNCTITGLVYGVNTITATAWDVAGNTAAATASIYEKTH